MIRYFICPLIAYLMAAPLTSLISIDLRETEWANVMTYVWFAGSWAVWGIIAIFVLFFIQAWRDM